MVDNSLKKTDLMILRQSQYFVVEVKYSFPYMPEEIYAEMREMVSGRDCILKDHNAAANRI